MARQFIVQPMAGFVARLPDAARNEIETRWPSLPADRIEREYESYQLIQPAVKAQPEAAELKRRFARIERAVANLKEELQWLNSTNLAHEVSRVCARAERAETLANAIDNLTTLQVALPYVRKCLPDGHQLTARQRLAYCIGLIIGEAGLPIDERPKGPLCQVVEILLQAAGENPSNVVTIVKPMISVILNALKKTTPTMA